MSESVKQRQQSGNHARSLHANAKWDAMRSMIERLYFEEQMSLVAVGEEIGYSGGAVRKHLKRWGHDLAKMGRAGPRNGRYKDGSRMRPYRHLITKDYCRGCGSVERLCIHHINNDHYDNRLENLTILCVSCHMAHHKREYWKAWRDGRPTPKSTGPVGWRS